MANEVLRAARSHLRGLRVLIVEDNWVIGKALQALLDEVGMVVTGPVPAAATAERLARKHTPQLAVVDAKLQDGMAFGLIDRLHDLNIRAVVLSGLAPLWIPPVKADAVLQKPCSDLELLTTLCEVLAENPSRAEPPRSATPLGVA
jgi:DNA-binding response OmpR family regulator